MKAALLIDFGSTYTKLTAVDLGEEEILGTAKSPSTVETDITQGYNQALALLDDDLQGIPHEFVEKLACSSAAGGLKMIALGLVPELTAEAAKRAALGAGARILHTYSFELDKSEISEIRESRPDIILLAGGTDGGNKDCIIHNAKVLAERLSHVPVIVGGNKKARDEIEDIFREKNVCYQVSENVMPKLNVINVEPVRESIKQMFIEKITAAKGMKKVEQFIGNVLMPTPAAVLKAAQLLADGTDKEEGLGELVIVDIGGATTDVHSIANGEAVRPGVTMRGLQEPYAKRSVEGDLGMRVSARALWEAAGTKKIRNYAPETPYDIEERCRFLANQVDTLPGRAQEREFDESLASVAVDLAMERHAGFLESLYTPMGIVYAQTGKDLQNVRYFIGTGGVLVHSGNWAKILTAGLAGEENSPCLKPRRPEMLLDKTYILSAMGLLAGKHPDKALRILKKYLMKTI